MKVGSGQFDQLRPQVRLQRLEQIAEVSLVEFGDDLAQKRRIAALNRIRDQIDEFGADVALVVPHRMTIQHRILRAIGGVGKSWWSAMPCSREMNDAAGLPP